MPAKPDPSAECRGLEPAPSRTGLFRPSLPPTSAAPAALHAGLPLWRSETLLRHGAEAHIVHLGQVYRLRQTAGGKLLLTK